MNEDLKKLKKTFWQNHKNIQRKTTPEGKLLAQKEQLCFCQKELSKLSEKEIDDLFGKFSDFVKRWIIAELVTNSFGKHLYVKLG